MSVPVESRQVIDLLRKIGEPITIFGEKDSHRRERLKEIISKLPNAQIRGITGQTDLVEMFMNCNHINRPETFYTEGSNCVKRVRKWLAKYSIIRSKNRIINQRNSDRLIKLTDKGICNEKKITKISTMKNDASDVADHRPVTCCCFNHDGSRLLTAYWTGIVKAWSVPSCKKLFHLACHRERITGLSSNPNANFVHTCGPAFATGSVDKTVRLWTNGGLLLDILAAKEDRIARVVFHPSGRLLASACFDQTWSLWDLEKTTVFSNRRQKLEGSTQILYEQEGHTSPVYSLSFVLKCSLLASGGLDSVGRIWDLRTGRNIITLKGHAGPILALDFSADGYHIVTGSLDNSCQVWDLRRTICRYSIAAHTKLVAHVKYRPGTGDYFVSAGYDCVARIWSGNDGKLLRVLEGHENKVMGVDVSPDPNSEIIATVGYDRALKLWRPDMTNKH
jgi:U4/U6 small nuclear ribonucleoprotein PRP4